MEDDLMIQTDQATDEMVEADESYPSITLNESNDSNI